MRKHVTAALCAAAMLVGAHRASAAIMVTTLSGIVTGGSDQTGLFGLAPGADLTGQSFSSSWRYDTDAEHYSVDATRYDAMVAISFGDIPPLNVVGNITINNVTFTIPEYSAVVWLRDFFDQSIYGPPDMFYAAHFESQTQIGQYTTEFIQDSILFHPFLDSAFVGEHVEDVNNYSLPFTGNVSISDIITSSGPSNHAVAFASADLLVTSSNTISVPEPGSWILLMLGFSSVGALLRRRQTTSRSVLRT